MDVLVLKEGEATSFDQLTSEVTAVARQGGAALLERIAEDFERVNGYLRTIEADVARMGMRPACHAGCAYCCHQSVSVSEMEAFALARHIERMANAAAVTARVVETAARIAPLSGGERFRQGIPCPLLDVATGRCGVYEARPFICRGHNSTSWVQCKKAARTGNSQSEIGAIRPMTVFGMITRQGYIDGLNAAGIRSAGLELTRALAVVLTTPDAYDRWLAGEDVFGRDAVRGRG